MELSDVVDRLRAAGCVYAEDEAAVLVTGTSSPTEVEDRLVRREAGEPLEQVVGWAAFCGHRIHVDPRVFVPRLRTEFLVKEASRYAREGAVVVDLCCGSGAVGVALAAGFGRVELHATDISPEAVACARRNLEPIGGHVHTGDLFSALPTPLRGRIDLVVVNAPYVPTAQLRLMPAEARDHEPSVALDGGEDGTDVQRRIIGTAPRWLAPDGVVVIETSELQAPTMVAIAVRHGLAATVARSAELDATVVTARRGPGLGQTDPRPDRT